MRRDGFDDGCIERAGCGMPGATTTGRRRVRGGVSIHRGDRPRLDRGFLRRGGEDGLSETTVLGVDVDDRTRLRAMELGWVDHALRPDDARLRAFLADSCELAVVATPVAAVDECFDLLRDVGYGGVVTDTISTKSHILEAARALLPEPRNFVPGHPMAGSERNGIDGARPDLFKGANWILCPDEQTVPSISRCCTSSSSGSARAWCPCDARSTTARWRW